MACYNRPVKRSCRNAFGPSLALVLGLSVVTPWMGAPALAHQDESVCALPPDMPVRDSRVRTLDGKTVALPGTEPTLVLFWSIFNPTPLPELAAASQRLASAHPGRLRVLGVNLDSRAIVPNLDKKVMSRARELGMTFPQALDPLRYSRDAFSLRKTPGAILVSEGRIVGVFSFDHAQDGPLMDALVRKAIETRSKR